MNIRTDPHTAERAIERGTSEDEIRDVLETGSPLPAAGDVIYTIEKGTVVTVTVYVFYGQWKDRT